MLHDDDKARRDERIARRQMDADFDHVLLAENISLAKGAMSDEAHVFKSPWMHGAVEQAYQAGLEMLDFESVEIPESASGIERRVVRSEFQRGRRDFYGD